MFGLPPNVSPPGNPDDFEWWAFVSYLLFVFAGFTFLLLGLWWLALPVFAGGLWLLFRDWPCDDEDDW